MPFHKDGVGEQLAGRLGEQAESLPQRWEIILRLRVDKERPHLVHVDRHNRPSSNQSVKVTFPKRSFYLLGIGRLHTVQDFFQVHLKNSQAKVPLQSSLVNAAGIKTSRVLAHSPYLRVTQKSPGASGERQRAHLFQRTGGIWLSVDVVVAISSALQRMGSQVNAAQRVQAQAATSARFWDCPQQKRRVYCLRQARHHGTIGKGGLQDQQEIRWFLCQFLSDFSGLISIAD
jgi:hypothetical protein